LAVQILAAGAISVASSPITWPIRPPLATLHCETPPQWFTDPGWNGLGTSFAQPVARAIQHEAPGPELATALSTRTGKVTSRSDPPVCVFMLDALTCWRHGYALRNARDVVA
jgi:hypothetical protein